MAEFNANDLCEYIEERIESNAISSAVDFVVECFKYKEFENKKVEILYRYSDITTIIEDSKKGKSTIVLRPSQPDLQLI